MPNLPKSLTLAVTLALAIPLSASDTSLPDAAESNDLTRIQSLITESRDLNASQADGMTALHWACYHDNTEAAIDLLEAGADANAKTRYNIQPLQIAVSNGNPQIAKRLLKAGADPNAVLRGGETLLMTASRVGKVDIVKMLLKAGVAVDAKERRQQTALMWAASAGHPDVVATLIDAGADMNLSLESGYTPFFFAIREGNKDVVRLFLDRGADINAIMNVKRGGGKRAANKSSPLIIAMENGHFELCMEFLEYGADPNDMRTGQSPLHALVRVRKPDRGEGARGEPPPVITGPIDSLTLAQELIDRGAEVDAVLQDGRKATGGRLGHTGATPFFLACDTADLAYMKLLYKNGADPKVKNINGSTTLMYAAGLDSHAPEEEAGTPPECLKAAKFLVNLGLDVNAIDDNGETAMHGAAYKNAPKVVKYLHEQGANIEIWTQLNKRGWSPLFIAEGYRPGNFKPDFATIDAIHEVMLASNLSIPTGPRPKHVNYAP